MAKYGHLESMKELLELGADVDLRDSNGATALHVAALAAGSKRTGDTRPASTCCCGTARPSTSPTAEAPACDLPTSNNVKRVLKRGTTLPAKAEKENATAPVKRASSRAHLRARVSDRVVARRRRDT